MTREEVKKVMAVIAAVYPNFHPTSMEATIDAWAVVLKDEPCEMIQAGLYAYIRNDVKGFAPSIGQILEQCRAMTCPRLSEGEAWALCRKAIWNGIYESHSEFVKLPREIQRAVGSPKQLYDWAMDDTANLNVIQSNFQRAYRAVCLQEDNASAIPERIRKLAIATAARMGGQERIEG